MRPFSQQYPPPVPQSRRLRGLQPNHGPCTKDCADYGVQQLRPILRDAGFLPTGMGRIPPQLSEMAGGNYFEFGYNPGVVEGTFGNKIYQPEEIAVMLEQQEGLAYNARSYVVSGWLNPYIAIEGYAVTSWPSATQFAEAIYQAIANAGYPIDYGSIQFRFEPYTASTVPTPPPLTGTPYPNTQTQTTQRQNQNQIPAPQGRCDWNKLDFGQWIACQLGLRDPLTGALMGATGAAIGIGAIALVGVALLKR